MARWRRGFGALVVTMCCVGALVGPAAATTGSLEPATVTLSTLGPRVLLPGRQSAIQLTGTGFVPGTTFSFELTIRSRGPVPVIDAVTFVPDGSSVTLVVTPPSQSLGLYLLYVTVPGEQTRPLDTIVVRSAAGTFNPINPFRALDTRSGIGGRVIPLGPSESMTLPMTGIGGIPATDVVAVTLNLTAVAPTADGYLTVYPNGTPFPTVSNLNFAAHRTVPNHVMVGVGADGAITIFNAFGQTHVLVDVVGWFGTESAPLGAGLALENSAPTRILDTRTTTAVAAHGFRTVTIPNAAARQYVAAVMNVTVVSTGAADGSPGYLSTFPTGSNVPNASTHNFSIGQTTANLVTARIGTGGGVTFFNGSSAPLHIIVDLQGEWSPPNSVAGLIFTPRDGGPTRLADTRNTPGTPIGPSTTATVTKPAIPDAASYVLNITATAPTAPGFVTLFPYGLNLPTASNLNFVAGQTVANQAIPGVMASSEAFAIYNDSGNTHIIVDHFGTLSLT